MIDLITCASFVYRYHQACTRDAQQGYFYQNRHVHKQQLGSSWVASCSLQPFTLFKVTICYFLGTSTFEIALLNLVLSMNFEVSETLISSECFLPPKWLGSWSACSRSCLSETGSSFLVLSEEFPGFKAAGLISWGAFGCSGFLVALPFFFPYLALSINQN